MGIGDWAMILRSPDDNFTLANVMRAELYSSYKCSCFSDNLTCRQGS